MRGISFLRQFVEIGLAIAIAPLFSGWIVQCRAWLQNRSAPPLWQPYRMLRKLFHKDVALATNASYLFRATPYVLFGTMVLAAAIIPSIVTDLPFARVADSIALIGLFATARVFLALAAMDIGTAFGTLGPRREMRCTYDAVPDPKLVVAVGDCGACGGVFGENYASRGAVANVIPVHHTVTGCPPHPAAILEAIVQTVRAAAIEA